jgi:co-chaperonin GroES (HSP10)
MLTEHEESKLILSPSLKNQKKAKSSHIMHIGENLSHLEKINATNGDLVFYNHLKAQHYQINDKKFIILQQSKIFGKEIVE